MRHKDTAMVAGAVIGREAGESLMISKVLVNAKARVAKMNVIQMENQTAGIQQPLIVAVMTEQMMTSVQEGIQLVTTEHSEMTEITIRMCAHAAEGAGI